MMTRPLIAAPLLATLLLGACRQNDPNDPPAIVYGESICAECGMIITDDRFGVATIVEGQRGAEALLFDDFNCQFNHERDRSDLVIVRRWARDHATRAWLDPDSARFVFAPSLRTPMGSHLAAFATDADAQSFARENSGQAMGLAAARDAVAGR